MENPGDILGRIIFDPVNDQSLVHRTCISTGVFVQMLAYAVNHKALSFGGTSSDVCKWCFMISTSGDTPRFGVMKLPYLTR